MTVHEWPDLERFSGTPMFNTKAVAQRTGVTPPTLRAWERRYSLLSPERADNDYRLYSERDIALIRWLKERVDNGISISQAIALFRHMQQERLHEEQPGLLPPLKGSDLPGEPSIFQVSTTPPAMPTEPGLELPYMAKTGQFDAEETNNGSPTAYDMRLVQERLVEAFRRFDEPTATMLLGSTLSIYPLEQVCLQLITPTLWEVGRLWSEGELSVSVEHFASNFFRALLTNLFHVTPAPRIGPFAIVCCGPGEPHELASLMLALFLRRNNVRVAYLGQSIEIKGLIQTIKQISPSLVCLSLTMPDYISAVISLCQHINKMLPPRPVLAIGGQAFSHNLEAISQIPGVYFKEDLAEGVKQLCRIIRERPESRN